MTDRQEMSQLSHRVDAVGQGEASTAAESPAGLVQRDGREWRQTPDISDALSGGQDRQCSDGVANPASDATGVHCPCPHEREQWDSFSRSIDDERENEIWLAELRQTGLDERRPGEWQHFGDVARSVVKEMVVKSALSGSISYERADEIVGSNWLRGA
jgi:hypothetical protein